MLARLAHPALQVDVGASSLTEPDPCRPTGLEACDRTFGSITCGVWADNIYSGELAWHALHTLFSVVHAPPYMHADLLRSCCASSGHRGMLS